MNASLTYNKTDKDIAIPMNWEQAMSLLRHRGHRKYWAMFILMGDVLSANVVLVSAMMGRMYRHASSDDVNVLLQWMPWLGRSLEDMTLPLEAICKPLHIPMVLRGEWVKPHGNNMTVKEYIYLDEYINKHSEEDEMAKYCLLAVMCRQIDPDVKSGRARQDMRIPLGSRDDVMHTAKIIKRYDKTYMMHANIQLCMASAMLMALGLKKYIHDHFITHLQSKDESGGTSNRINFGWHSVVQDVAEAGTFGTLDDVYNCYFYDFVTYLINKKQAADAMSAKMK